MIERVNRDTAAFQFWPKLPDSEPISSYAHHTRMAEAWTHRRFRFEYTLETLRLFVKPMNFCCKGRVLVVGSGIGTRVAALRTLGVDAFGLDCEERVVRQMTVKEAVVYNRVGNLLHLPDLIAVSPYYCISDDVLEHLPVNSVLQFLRLSREAGIKEMIHSITTLEHQADIHQDPGHVSKFGSDEWKNILNSSGWKVVGTNQKARRFGVFHLMRG